MTTSRFGAVSRPMILTRTRHTPAVAPSARCPTHSNGNNHHSNHHSNAIPGGVALSNEHSNYPASPPPPFSSLDPMMHPPHMMQPPYPMAISQMGGNLPMGRNSQIPHNGDVAPPPPYSPPPVGGGSHVIATNMSRGSHVTGTGSGLAAAALTPVEATYVVRGGFLLLWCGMVTCPRFILVLAYNAFVFIF